MSDEKHEATKVGLETLLFALFAMIYQLKGHKEIIFSTIPMAVHRFFYQWRETINMMVADPILFDESGYWPKSAAIDEALAALNTSGCLTAGDLPLYFKVQVSSVTLQKAVPADFWAAHEAALSEMAEDFSENLLITQPTKISLRKLHPNLVMAAKTLLFAIFSIILEKIPTFSFYSDPRRINGIFYKYRDALDGMHFRTTGIYPYSDDLEQAMQELHVHQWLEPRNIHGGIYLIWLNAITCCELVPEWFMKAHACLLGQIAGDFINELQVKEPLLPGS